MGREPARMWGRYGSFRDASKSGGVVTVKGHHVSTDGGGKTGQSTRVSLLQQLQVEDPQGWSRLVALYGPMVFHWCRRMGLQSHDAADVVQEVYRSVRAKIIDFRRRQHGSFRCWLKTITRNKVHDFWRHCEREPPGVGGSEAQSRMAQVADAQEEATATVEDQQEMDQVYGRVLELIRGEFASQTWLAFTQVVLESRAAHDVAADLRISVNAVYIAKSRVLSRIRAEFEEFLD